MILLTGCGWWLDRAYEPERRVATGFFAAAADSDSARLRTYVSGVQPIEFVRRVELIDPRIITAAATRLDLTFAVREDSVSFVEFEIRYPDGWEKIGVEVVRQGGTLKIVRVDLNR